MKIHSTTQVARGTTPIASSFSRLMALCGVACLAFAGQAMGQTSPVQNGLFTHGDQSYEVVSTAAYKTAADSSTDPLGISPLGSSPLGSSPLGSSPLGSIQQVGNCSTCGTSSCGGSCGTMSMATSSCGSCGTSCGGSCGGDSRMSALSCGADFSNVCAPCQPYTYITVEGLYMTRESENVSVNQPLLSTPIFAPNSFDGEWAPRITLGNVADCVQGYEMAFVGPLEWDNNVTLANNGSRRYEAEYMSFEANKTINGWEVAKLLIGGRYIDYEENFNFSINNAASSGAVQANNQLFGLQVGMDLLYPVSRIGYSDLRLRAGAYYNDADYNLSVNDNGTVFARNRDEAELAGVFELGGGMRYQLGDMLAIRAGAELWYLSGLAIAPDQFDSARFNDINVDDSILITGVSVGAELRY